MASKAPIAHLACPQCQRQFSMADPQTLCPHCALPLAVRYDLASLRAAAPRPSAAPDCSLWRFSAVIPESEPLSNSEANTPLVRSRRFPNLWWKRESRTTCGVAAARGLALALAVLRQTGHRKATMQAGGAEAIAFCTYAAAAGLNAELCLAAGADFGVELRCRALGATITHSDIRADTRADTTEPGPATGAPWYDLSHPDHPLRVEGDKTLGYELAEQLQWRLPEAVIASPGLGPALSKAFAELEQFGWLTQPGSTRVLLTQGQSPEAVAAVALEWAREEGLLLSPQAAACAATWSELLDRGELTLEQTVVLVEQGDAAESVPLLASALGLRRPIPLPARMPVGGIITPQ